MSTEDINSKGDALLTKLLDVCIEAMDHRDENGKVSSAMASVARQLLKDLGIQATTKKPEVQKLVDTLPSFEDETPFDPSAPLQ